MNLLEEFLGIIDTLNAAHIDYAVCGGLAVAYYGYPRFTKDIDLLILAADLPHIRKLLEPRGFVFYSGAIPFDPGSGQARVIHRLSKIEGQDVLALDLMIVGPVFDSIWNDRDVVLWVNRKVQIVSSEGLAQMKRLAGRDQDHLDLKQLGLWETLDE